MNPNPSRTRKVNHVLFVVGLALVCSRALSLLGGEVEPGVVACRRLVRAGGGVAVSGRWGGWEGSRRGEGVGEGRGECPYVSVCGRR